MIIFTVKSIRLKTLNYSISTLLVFLLVNINAFSQCKDRIVPIESNQLKYKDRGNRCEGFYRAMVSANDLELLSFSKGQFDFEQDLEEVIYLHTIPDTNELNIQALGIPLGLYYRMDAILSQNAELSWEVNSVLLKSKQTRQAKNIGLLCDNGKRGIKKTYYPVFIRTEKKGEIEGPLQIILKCTVKLRNIKWRFDFDEAPRVYREGQKVEAYRPFIITLPDDLTAGKTYILDIIALESGSTQKLSKRIRIKL